MRTQKLPRRTTSVSKHAASGWQNATAVAVPETFARKGRGGRLYGKHHRRGDGEDKAVWWTDHTGSGLKVNEFPFHRSERAREWGQDDVVLIVEGEVAAEAADRGLGSLDVAVLDTLGTSHMPRGEFFEVLSGRTVLLWTETRFR